MPRADDHQKGASPALLALLHPWSLLALLLLGLNDHLWKGIGPTWLTGKLSDFAGLFYFPFLVLLLLGWILPARWTRNPRRLTIAVFWGVGIWFAAAKSIPIVHRATVAFAELFLGEVQVVMDATDGIALLSLLPAWLLYKRVSESPPRAVSRVLKPVALGVTFLLTAATSQPWSPSVNNLLVHEGQLYASVGDYYYPSNTGNEHFYTTLDGVTWTEVEVLPPEEGEVLPPEEGEVLSPEVFKEHKQQRTVLWKGEKLSANGNEVLSAGGTHGFRISEGRQEFMRTSGAKPYGVSDMALLPNAPDTLVVAMQTQGVAVLDSSGKWTRHSVGGAIPTPVTISSTEPLADSWLSLAVFGISASSICWILVSLLIWRSQREGVPPSAKLQSRRIPWNKKAGLFLQNARESFGKAIRGRGHMLRGGLCMLSPALIFWGNLYPSRLNDHDIPLLPIISIPFIGLSLIMIAIRWNDFNEKHKRKPKKTYFLSSLPLGVLAIGSILLWYFGYFESVTTAIGVSALLIVAQVTWVAGRLPRQ